MQKTSAIIARKATWARVQAGAETRGLGCRQGLRLGGIALGIGQGLGICVRAAE